MTTRYILVITGSSRGFGRAVGRAFFEKLGGGALSLLHRTCLVARSSDGLAETQQELQKMSSSATISTHTIDLGNLDTLEDQWKSVLEELQSSDIVAEEEQDTRLILINNAGSLGHLGPLLKATSSSSSSLTKDIQKTIDLNVTGLITTTILWGRWAAQHSIAATFVNISSLTAVEGFPTMAIYSAGKAVSVSFVVGFAGVFSCVYIDCLTTRMLSALYQKGP